MTLLVKGSEGGQIVSLPLEVGGSDWVEVPFAFTSSKRNTQASIQIAATGRGSVLFDFISMMRTDARRNGMLCPDLLGALRGLRPQFIRWPGGSFASTYKWKEGIGPYASRGYHPNTYRGGYFEARSAAAIVDSARSFLVAPFAECNQAASGEPGKT